MDLVQASALFCQWAEAVVLSKSHPRPLQRMVVCLQKVGYEELRGPCLNIDIYWQCVVELRNGDWKNINKRMEASDFQGKQAKQGELLDLQRKSKDCGPGIGRQGRTRNDVGTWPTKSTESFQPLEYLKIDGPESPS